MKNYRAAFQYGARDLPAGEAPPERPLGLLATAVPRLISLAVAANVWHVLPSAADDQLTDHLLATLHDTATGALHRCHVALQADGRARGYSADEWLPLTYDAATHALSRADPSAQPPSLIEHAQQAGRWTALAIGAIDRDDPQLPEAICDILSHLLIVCVFIDATPPSG